MCCVYLFMDFDQIYGHESQIKALRESISLGRIPHAQMFVGPEGVGLLPLAIAFMRAVFCSENNTEVNACNVKFDRMAHPDVHFVFPVATNDKVKSKPTSGQFLEEWRLFLETNPFGSLFDWHKHLGIDKKQGQIGVTESEEITKKLSLTSYEGGWKGVVVWHADKLNTSAANKLLKIVEEPPQKTLLLFVTNHEDRVLETLRSRCQTTEFSLLPEKIIRNALVRVGASDTDAKQLAVESNGSVAKAIDLFKKEESPFEDWFVRWVRMAFKARGNKSAVVELLEWSQHVAKSGRENQKQFLVFSIELFRQALLIGYGLDDLSRYKPKGDFDLKRFSSYVHNGNIHLIVKELEDAYTHVERNGNPKMIFTDLSLKLTRHIHKSPVLSN